MRNGRAPDGKQKSLCRACQKQSRENPTPHAYPEQRREEILRAYEERSSLGGLERTFGVSRPSVIEWIKKAGKLPALSDTPVEPDPHDAEASVLELDELWSFVVKKTNQAWIWIALCRKTRQVVACGRPFQQPTVPDTATRISGQPIRLSSQRSSTQLLERTPGKRLMWNAGTIPCDSVWLGLYAKRFLSRNRCSCTMRV